MRTSLHLQDSHVKEHIKIDNLFPFIKKNKSDTHFFHRPSVLIHNRKTN